MHHEENRLKISARVSIPLAEIEMEAVRASGPGGQNVNKVSSAIHLRFDIVGSSLPDFYKQRLLKLNDSRITRDGTVVIKAQNHREQEKNRAEALQRLAQLIRRVATVDKKRIATKPTRASRQRRLESKKRQGERKALRRKPVE
jgi:ribosome-associated protein